MKKVLTPDAGRFSFRTADANCGLRGALFNRSYRPPSSFQSPDPAHALRLMVWPVRFRTDRDGQTPCKVVPLDPAKQLNYVCAVNGL